MSEMLVAVVTAGVLTYGAPPAAIYNMQTDIHQRKSAMLEPTQYNEVLELARIIDGESRHDLEAAYYVGWVAKNRKNHKKFGNTFKEVSKGFFGYDLENKPSIKVVNVARDIIKSKYDPTKGCLFALSDKDVENLDIPEHIADATKGAWFFFKVWPGSSNVNQ